MLSSLPTAGPAAATGGLISSAESGALSAWRLRTNQSDTCRQAAPQCKAVAGVSAIQNIVTTMNSHGPSARHVVHASRTLPAAFRSMLRTPLYFQETTGAGRYRKHLLVCEAQLLCEDPPLLRVRLADTLIQVLQGIQLGLSKGAATHPFLLRLRSRQQKLWGTVNSSGLLCIARHATELTVHT